MRLKKTGLLIFVILFFGINNSYSQKVVSPELASGTEIISPSSNGSYYFSVAVKATGITFQNTDGSPVVGYLFTGGSVSIIGDPVEGKILSGGSFDANALGLFQRSKGKEVLIEFRYKGADGISRIGTMTVKVK